MTSKQKTLGEARGRQAILITHTKTGFHLRVHPSLAPVLGRSKHRHSKPHHTLLKLFLFINAAARGDGRTPGVSGLQVNSG
jgi:hypothetical protein